jgi:sortase A
MRRVLGKILLYAGILAVISSAGLSAYAYLDENRTRNNAARTTVELSERIQRAGRLVPERVRRDAETGETNVETIVEFPEANPEENPLRVIEIDGELYIGILAIPSLSLELPINKELRESSLKDSPCRYTGDLSGSLVISAHNYKNHFGALHTLSAGDTAIITDAAGDLHQYTVEHTELLHETDVDAMINSPYDLTLFTCTRSRTERVTVRFSKTRLNGGAVIASEPDAPKAPNLRINYRNETIRIRKGYSYSADGGVSFTDVTARRGITLDVSDNITSGVPIYIRRSAANGLPASHPQIITPSPRV